MKYLFFLALFFLSIPLSAAHSDIPHNYAGSGYVFYFLIALLVIGLMWYEKLGDTSLGLSVLGVSIFLPLYIGVFSVTAPPSGKHLAITTFFALMIIMYNYRKKQ